MMQMSWGGNYNLNDLGSCRNDLSLKVARSRGTRMARSMDSGGPVPQQVEEDVLPLVSSASYCLLTVEACLEQVATQQI